MSIGELETESLERSIEKARERLNCLMNQNISEVTEEVLYISQELDTLINDYYNHAKRKK